MDCSLPGSSVHGISQARVLEWVAISFSRGSPQPRDQTQVSRITGRCFTLWVTRLQIHDFCKYKITKTPFLIILSFRRICFNLGNGEASMFVYFTTTSPTVRILIERNFVNLIDEKWYLSLSEAEHFMPISHLCFFFWFCSCPFSLVYNHLIYSELWHFILTFLFSTLKICIGV